MTPVVTNIVGAVTNITGGAIVINPLANKLAPVVEAINAPLMIGIEDALATCGITITNQNAHRAAMSAVSDTWKNAVLDGDVAPAQQAPYLTALKVRLGIKDYNKFVDVYNNGAPK
jgi:hypothetical protein